MSVEKPKKFIDAISGISETMARYDLVGIMGAPAELSVELAGTTDACRARFHFRTGRTTIGRGDDCNVQIEAEDVSRHHATIEVAGDLVTILDAGSSNGTFVNGTRVEEARLGDGDVLSLGPRLRFVTVIRAPLPKFPAPIQARLANDTLVDLKADPTRLPSATIELLEGERRQLALLLQISMRYLTSVGEDPVDTLFDILSRVIRFDAAFVSDSRARSEFRVHPEGARLTQAECARLARECAHGPVVQDGTGAAVSLTALTAASRALLPLDGGGCIGLLARDAHGYAQDMDFLGILARIHGAAAAIRAKAR